MTIQYKGGPTVKTFMARKGREARVTIIQLPGTGGELVLMLPSIRFPSRLLGGTYVYFKLTYFNF
jgi:hypothetical protein